MVEETTNLQVLQKLQDRRSSDGFPIREALKEVLDTTEQAPGDRQLWSWLLTQLEKDAERSRWAGELPDMLRWTLASLGGFFRSGFFFMLIGFGLLVIADVEQGDTHSTFTFVYVVLGVAIILYGTGTQAAGTMNSPVTGDWKFQGSLVGGAGLLAILVGYTIVMKYPEMRSAFSQQRSYVRVFVTAQSQQFGPNYGPGDHILVATADSVALPVAHEAGKYVIYLPYLSNKRPCNFVIEAELHSKNGSSPLYDKFILQSEELKDEACAETAARLSDYTIARLYHKTASGIDFEEATTTLSFDDSSQQSLGPMDFAATTGSAEATGDFN